MPIGPEPPDQSASSEPDDQPEEERIQANSRAAVDQRYSPTPRRSETVFGAAYRACTEQNDPGDQAGSPGDKKVLRRY